MDNDIYRHINNLTYYSYFDSAVNHYLIEEANLDIQHATLAGYVVSSNCQYRAPLPTWKRYQSAFESIS